MSIPTNEFLFDKIMRYAIWGLSYSIVGCDVARFAVWCAMKVRK